MEIVIAIDGPVAAGKSTVAKLVAEKLNYRYVDTGAMYRCIALLAKRSGIDASIEVAVLPLLNNAKIVLGRDKKVYLNDEDVTDAIRTPEISNLVSIVSVHKGVRDFLLVQQQAMGKEKGVVMEGRDIGSFVLPDADLKIFQVASVESRAKRRYLELIERGAPRDYDQLVNEITERDYRDSHRQHAPLTKVADSIVIDTSEISAETAADIIVALAKEKLNA